MNHQLHVKHNILPRTHQPHKHQSGKRSIKIPSAQLDIVEDEGADKPATV